MTSTHLTTEEIRRYEQRTLSPGELIRLTDHLAACADCRGRVSESHAEPPARRIQHALLGWGEDAGAHSDEDDLAAHVDGALEPARAGLVAEHLDVCASCAADVQHLQALRAGADARSTSPRRVRPLRWGGLAAAAALTAVVVSGIGRWTRGPSGPEERHPPAAGGTPTNGQTETVLNDASGPIVRLSDGRWTGWPTQPGAVDDAVRRALVSQALDVSEDVLGLRGVPSNLRNASPNSASFLVDPIGVVVEDDRPPLRWRPVPGARHYVVTVLEESGDALVKSPPLATTGWTPPPLARGRSYQWQVTAHTAAGRTTAPQPPAPEARFRVVDRDALAALTRARRSPARSHLVLAVLSARAGLLDEAERELTALAALNPGPSVAARLLADLQKQVSQNAAPTTENAAQ
jgi:hypothetical protein